jgi:hypothetical protein
MRSNENAAQIIALHHNRSAPLASIGFIRRNRSLVCSVDQVVLFHITSEKPRSEHLSV